MSGNKIVKTFQLLLNVCICVCLSMCACVCFVFRVISTSENDKTESIILLNEQNPWTRHQVELNAEWIKYLPRKQTITIFYYMCVQTKSSRIGEKVYGMFPLTKYQTTCTEHITKINNVYIKYNVIGAKSMPLHLAVRLIIFTV